MNKEKQGKKWAACLLCVGMACSFWGCQEDPEGSVVVHKDMNKLVSQAAASGPERVDAKEVAKEVAQSYESYQTTLENESLGVKVQVDARVEVPKAEKLGVYRVEQKNFTQEFIDKVRAELLGETPLYKGLNFFDASSNSRLAPAGPPAKQGGQYFVRLGFASEPCHLLHA